MGRNGGAKAGQQGERHDGPDEYGRQAPMRARRAAAGTMGRRFGKWGGGGRRTVRTVRGV